MSRFNLSEELASIKKAKLMALPLVLILIPVVLIQIPFEFLYHLIIRIPPFSKNVDASADVPGTSPLPKGEPYVGGNDMFGFMSYLKRWKDPWILPLDKGIEKSPATGVPEGVAVRVENIGFPCVTVNDVKASESVINQDHFNHAYYQCPLKFFMESTTCCIYLKGAKAHATRGFLSSIIPKSEDDEELFQNGLKGMEMAAKDWIAANPKPDCDKEEFVACCTTGFNSTLLTGEYIPHEIISAVKGGFLFLSFPRFFPGLLFPPHHAMRKARTHVHKRIKASPRWPTILAAAKEYGFSASEACDNLIPVMCFNGQGLVDSLHMALDFMPTYNYGRDMNQKALESFAWETLRFNGPPGVKNTVGDEPLIIETSAGQKYALKPKTNLFVCLFSVHWDELVWPNAESFKVDRYLNSDSSTTKKNPYPTTAFGIPLGSIKDTARNAKTHSCLMGPYTHRVIAYFIKMMSDPSMEYTLPPDFDAPKHLKNMREHIHSRAQKMSFKKHFGVEE